MRKFGLDRRRFFGSAFILAGSVFSKQKLFAAAGTSITKPEPGQNPLTGLGGTGNVDAELGLNTVINAQGTILFDFFASCMAMRWPGLTEIANI